MIDAQRRARGRTALLWAIALPLTGLLLWGAHSVEVLDRWLWLSQPLAPLVWLTLWRTRG